MTKLMWLAAAWFSCVLASCGASDTNSGENTEVESDGGTVRGDGATAGDLSKDSGARRDAAVVIPDGTIVVKFTKTGCDGDCALITAEPTSGRAPFIFEWANGTKSAEARLCPSEKGTLTVSDAGEVGEFSRDPWVTKASVPADLLRCGAVEPSAKCGEPKLIVKAVPSGPTALLSGALQGYQGSASYAGGMRRPVYVVAEGSVSLDATCSKFLLAGNKEGTKDLGWDDHLLVEYRSAPEAEISKRWQYSAFDLVYMAQTVPTATAPTVIGALLDPPVPNPAPYGYPALALDLKAQLPEAATSAVLSLTVLDEDFIGSTTDIWLLPQ